MELATIDNNKKISVNPAVFAIDYNEGLVHQVVVAYMAGGRQGSKAQKNRAAVSGGGSKPFRQKGTGRARAGTIRSPLWRSGGKTFAAKPRSYKQKVNRKVYRKAIAAMLSELVRLGRLVAVEKFAVETPKTKQLLARLAELKLTNTLIVTEDLDVNLVLASRNLINVTVITPEEVNPVVLLAHQSVLMTSAALAKVQESLV